MRTLRLSLVGSAILALLGGMGGAAMAQDDEAGSLDWTQSTMFSGTSTYKAVGFGSRTEEDILRQRGFTTECTEEMSDPRVSGVSTTTWDNDCYPWIGCVGWGTFELVGPDGSWVGTFTQTLGHGDEGLMLNTAIGEGTDGYEGWAYIAHSTSPDPYMQGTIEGFVFPGDSPPLR